MYMSVCIHGCKYRAYIHKFHTHKHTHTFPHTYTNKKLHFEESFIRIHRKNQGLTFVNQTGAMTSSPGHAFHNLTLSFGNGITSASRTRVSQWRHHRGHTLPNDVITKDTLFQMTSLPRTHFSRWRHYPGPAFPNDVTDSGRHHLPLWSLSSGVDCGGAGGGLLTVVYTSSLACMAVFSSPDEVTPSGTSFWRGVLLGPVAKGFSRWGKIPIHYYP